jgi:DNA-binding response OmpR family regulator
MLLIIFSLPGSPAKESLQYLWQQRNHIIDRCDILHLLWGSDSFFNSRNLDAYIIKRRGYLKEDLSLEIITMKGVGDRFVTENLTAATSSMSN